MKQDLKELPFIVKGNDKKLTFDDLETLKAQIKNEGSKVIEVSEV